MTENSSSPKSERDFLYMIGRDPRERSVMVAHYLREIEELFESDVFDL
jgi:hypothetical protein